MRAVPTRCFKPGEGPSRGLLCDCEIFANLRLAFVSSSIGQGQIGFFGNLAWKAEQKTGRYPKVSLLSSSGSVFGLDRYNFRIFGRFEEDLTILD